MVILFFGDKQLNTIDSVFYSKIKGDRQMRRENFKIRLLSLILVFVFLVGNIFGVFNQNISIVRAQTDNQAAATDNIDEDVTGSKGDTKEEESSTEETKPDESLTEDEKTDQTDVKNDEVEKKEADKSKDSVSSGSEVKGKNTDKKNFLENKKTKEKKTTEKKDAKSGMELTAVLRVDGYGKRGTYPVSVTLPDKYKSLKEYGLDGEKDPGYYTPLHLMAQYCIDHGIDPADSVNGININAGYLQNFLGIKSNKNTFFMFEINNMYPSNNSGTGYTLGDYPLKNGDLVVLYDWFWSDTSAYAYFTEENMTATKGEPFTVTLKQNDGMSTQVAGCEGTDIIIEDVNGNELQKGTDYTLSGKTDSDGNVSVTIAKEGTYILTGERKNGQGNHELNRPYAKVIVGKSSIISDEEAVRKAKEELSVKGADAVGDSIILPDVGNYATSLKWELKSPDKDGKYVAVSSGTKWQFYRPVKDDVKITLTATIQKGSAFDTKDIVLTLKGKIPRLANIQVNHGTLEFDSNKRDYEIYVPKKDDQGNDIKELEITVDSGECSLVWINSSMVFGSKKISLNDDKPTVITIEGQVNSTVDGGQSYKDTAAIITVKRGNPGKPLPELPNISWGQHLGNKDNNALVDYKTPTGKGELLWESFSNAPDSWGSVYAGTPILINGNIYAVRNNKIEMLDSKTGKVNGSADLYSQIGYYSNIIYGGGMIFVPLGNGMIQCFNASTLQSLYLLNSPANTGAAYNVYGAMHYENGRLYVGYSDGAWSNPVGCYAAYDTTDLDVDDEKEYIDPLWVSENANGQSYYGSGAVTVDDKVVIAGDSGIVYVLNSITGKEISSCQLDGQVRGPLVYAKDYIWTATNAGNIYKLSLDSSGNIKVVSKGELPLSTTSSPVVYSDKIYITGGTFTDGGFFAVYDLDLNLLAKKKTPSALNTPTVTSAYDDVYAYFTENGEKGSLYMAKVTSTNKITVTEIYTPEHKQYSMSKVVVGADGTLYYSNDSGYLFAICASSTGNTDDGKDDDKNEGKDEGKDIDKKGEHNKSKDVKGEKNKAKNISQGVKTVRVNAATGEKTSFEDSLIKAVINSGKKHENILTVNNPPDTVGREVFAELVKYPNLRLVFNCGTYTLSIKGSDITDTKASLTTKLIEMEKSPIKDRTEYGNYKQFAFVQEGPLPGKVTVVYKLGKEFKSSKGLYLYDTLGGGEVKEVVFESPYAMFTLDHAGTYILSDSKSGALERSITGTSGNVKVEKNVIWLYLVLGVGIGALIGGIITASVIHRRKREDTWEK